MKNLVLVLTLALTGLFANDAFGLGFYNSSNTNLGQVHKFKCSTGLTCTATGGLLTMSSSPTLTSALTLQGAEATDAIINLQADESDDDADDWRLQSTASGNAFSVLSNATGSYVARFSLSTAGVLTFTDSETLTNASDQLTWTFDDAAARINYVGFEASNSSIYLQADESDDSGDDWAINSNASGNSLTISNDASGSQVTKLTIGTNGNLTIAGAKVYNAVQTFTDLDATPDVSGYTYFNTNTSAVTITDFDGAGIVAGQELIVNSKGAITYDVTSSGLLCGSTDIITANHDMTRWIYDGTDWRCTAFIDASDNLN